MLDPSRLELKDECKEMSSLLLSQITPGCPNLPHTTLHKVELPPFVNRLLAATHFSQTVKTLVSY